MEAHIFDWLGLLVRWLHFIVGVAWIGASFYFVWLENHLDRLNKDPEIAGDLWAIHGGGFYFVKKFKNGPERMPETLHWFKYEAYFTWLSGFILLCLVYYANANLYLVDARKWDVSALGAIGTGLAVLFGGWVVYDALCKSPLVKKGYLFALVNYVLLLGLTYLLCHLFNPRGAYIHVGALLGTCMAANVFFVIIPSQKKMVRCFETGEKMDERLGAAAHARSRHNNYMTLPVLFVMISSHFPMTFAHEQNWVVLGLMIILGVLIRHWFNLKGVGKSNRWLVPVSAALLLFLVYYTAPVQKLAQAETTKVSFSEVQAVISKRCVSCHSQTPSDSIFTVAPAGVMFDRPEDIKPWADRIKLRAVTLRTMPFANKTGMTDRERAVLGHWVDSGAPLK